MTPEEIRNMSTDVASWMEKDDVSRQLVLATDILRELTAQLAEINAKLANNRPILRPRAKC